MYLSRLTRSCVNFYTFLLIYLPIGCQKCSDSVVFLFSKDDVNLQGTWHFSSMARTMVHVLTFVYSFCAKDINPLTIYKIPTRIYISPSFLYTSIVLIYCLSGSCPEYAWTVYHMPLSNQLCSLCLMYADEY